MCLLCSYFGPVSICGGEGGNVRRSWVSVSHPENLKQQLPTQINNIFKLRRIWINSEGILRPWPGWMGLLLSFFPVLALVAL